MKTIDEFGISPTPWERTHNHPRIVWNGMNLPLVTGINPADARLIAAAPDLYDALKCIFDDMCGCCCHRDRCLVGDDDKTGHCEQWEAAKAALAKAGGEEAK